MTDSSHRVAALEAAWAREAASYVALLRTLVDVNSFSENVAGVVAVRDSLGAELERRGFACEIVTPSTAPLRAGHLVARRKAQGAPSVLLIGHCDTVFPPEDAFRGFRQEGDELLGPGVGDMKGGDVALLAALDLLEVLGSATSLDLTIYLAADEEVGHPESPRLVGDLARGCVAALGFEPAHVPAGDTVASCSRLQHVIGRKGCGRFRVELQGTAAHSGGAHHLGASAIEALARKVTAVHALTNSARGVTTNVGLVGGGRSVNTVAPHSWAEVDFRFVTIEDGRELEKKLRALLGAEEDVNPSLAKPVTARLAPGGGLLWPPLLATDASRALSALVIDVSASLGIAAEAIVRGGASDAAHAAAAGVPALCGLGPAASGIHSDQERTSVAALRRSALVTALLLDALAKGEPSRARA